MSEIVHVADARLKLSAGAQLAAMAEAFFSRMSPRTRKAYGAALQDLAGWMQQADGVRAIAALLALGQGGANLRVMEYMASMKQRKLAPASMNQRLAAIKSMVKLARQAGLVSWTLDVKAEKVEKYRDTQGPGLLAIGSIMSMLAGSITRKAARDLAILRLLFDLGLRRAEVVSLDLEHLDLEGRRLDVLRKGRTERKWLTLPAPTCEALAGWVELRGSAAGPLFISLDHARKGDGRLTADGLYKLLKAYGAELGFKVRPHGIRHTAITEVGKRTNGNMVIMASFSDHTNMETLRHYIDNMKDLQGEAASLLAGIFCSLKERLSRTNNKPESEEK